MRRPLRVLPLLCLLTAGCERYPEDPVFLYGRALSTDGTPLTGAVLGFERTAYEAFSVPDPVEPPTFSSYGTATVQANGDFTLQVLYGDLEATEGEDHFFAQYRFRVALPLEDGRGTFLSFTMQDDAELPPLQPWDDHAAVGTGPQGPTVSFAPAPPAPELPPSARLRTIYFGGGGYVDENGNYVEDEPPTMETLHPTTPEPIVHLLSGGATLWRQSGIGSPWTASPYVLEDFASPEAQLRALCLGSWDFTPLGANGSSIEFRQEWRSARLPLPAGTLRPVSRGASCQPSPADGCPWTDGRLTPVSFTAPGSGAPATGTRALTVSLAAPTRLKRAVVRGLRYSHEYTGWESLRVEGSADGETWTPLGQVVIQDPDKREADLRFQLRDFAVATSWDSPFDAKLAVDNEAPAFLDLALETPELVRHVRFRVETEAPGDVGGTFLSLAEVSLFE